MILTPCASFGSANQPNFSIKIISTLFIHRATPITSINNSTVLKDLELRDMARRLRVAEARLADRILNERPRTISSTIKEP